MQYKKMTKSQKVVKNWRAKRNVFLKSILDADKRISRDEAIKLANKMMRR